MKEMHCGYPWPGGNHWSRRTKMGVCAVPQHTCTQNMHQISSRAVHKQPTVYTSPHLIWPCRLDHYCFKIASFSQILLSSNPNHYSVKRSHEYSIVTSDADIQWWRSCLSDRGMSVRMILYKRVRWEERCRLECKFSVGRLGPVFTAQRSTELETCEYANTLT